jgi:L-histidine N-alpha-methyltransferase
MHLVALRDTRVTLGQAGADLVIGAGERIRTEVSRKFTRGSTEDLLKESGFRLRRWFVPPDNLFALALASV